MNEYKDYRKAVGSEGFVCLAFIIIVFLFISDKMGIVNMFKTVMATAHNLLLNTVFFIMAIAVLSGALAGILSEFGVIAIINKILSPLMKPLYDLPGAAALGIVTTYLSDNPAILTLAEDENFKKYFKKYQLPALTNLGTSFGMGLVVTTFMMSQKSTIGENFILPALIGNIGAVIGSIVSVRIMIIFTKKIYNKDEMVVECNDGGFDLLRYRKIRKGNVVNRLMESMLDGGKCGVDVGISIIPGVLIICTLVFILSGEPSSSGCYTGAAYEGIPVLPWIGNKLSFILKPLLGFKNSKSIAFPITALGAVGAAISLVPQFLQQNIIGGNEIAVFTAMGMCWSGYLSTHVAMMDSLKCRQLTGKAILSHTIGGIIAGISAHFMYLLLL